MSRLLGIIILSFLITTITGSPGQAQASYEGYGLTKDEYIALRKKVRKMTLAEQVSAFNPLPDRSLSLANLDTINQVGQFPLPSWEALSKTAQQYPDFLADILGVHYFFSLEKLPPAEFYGLDSAGRRLQVEAYKNASELSQALVSHDFILPAKAPLYSVTQKKSVKKIKKALQQKLIRHYAAEKSLPALRTPDPELRETYKKWVIQVYGSNKEIHSLKKSPYALLETRLPDPDENWLSQLISGQIMADGFNQKGERQKLVNGRARMFEIDTTVWLSADSLIAGAIKQRAMPGCQLLVAKDGYVVLEKAYGYQTYDSLLPINNHTLYDLASLTKVLATTQALMLLYDEGKFKPEEKLTSYLPYLAGTNKAEITGTDVLSHQANLYLYYPFWKKAREEFELELMQGSRQAGSKLAVEAWVSDSIVHWAAESALLSEKVDTITREQYFYSDVGFFFLKDLIEKQAGQTLDDYLHDHLYEPNGLGLMFNPLSIYADSLIAPTEFDRYLRNELVRGYVHDRNAALLGGVAGQAGLFGNARYIAELMQIHLDQGRHLGRQVFSPAVIGEFTRRHFENNRRGLGWDMPALPAGRPGPEPDGPVSTYASQKTFGHTGFTGGMVWADPQENLIFVFLSNRVYPSAENNKLVEMNIRTRIQDIIYRSLGYQ